VECITYLRARADFGLRPHFHHAQRASLRHGFRRVVGAKRLFVKCARIRARRACLRARVARLIEALINPQPHIAIFLKRLAHGLHGARLILCAPPAQALALNVARSSPPCPRHARPALPPRL
jgi:hypothetical protein